MLSCYASYMETQIGDVRQSRDIWGGTNRHNFMWCACPNCGKERWVLITKGEPTSKRCNACAIRKPRTGQTVNCAICGKEVYVRPSVLRSKKYCSRECANRGLVKGHPLVCKVCGDEYYRPPSQVELRGSSFCSNRCKGNALSVSQLGDKNLAWKNGISTENHRLRASKKWRVWREAVFERDNYTCQDCGNRGSQGNPLSLHPHHINSFAEYPSLRFVVRNGITLCEKCHKGNYHAK